MSGNTQGGTPDHVTRKDLTPEAAMFSSRQQAVFSKDIRHNLTTDPAPSLSPISSIEVAHLTHLRDIVKDPSKLPYHPNEFQRIRYQISNRQRLQQQRLQQDIAAHRYHPLKKDEKSKDKQPKSVDNATAAVAAAGTGSAATTATAASQTTATVTQQVAGDSTETDNDFCPHRTLFRPSYNRFVGSKEYVLVDDLRSEKSPNTAFAFHAAGPREYLAWTPGEVKACIVTCGGLCPGLNNVIQELFYCLHYNYGVDVIYGIRSGYRGLWYPEYQPWLRLTPELVQNINEVGGSILGSSRGGFDAKRIVNALEVYGVNQVYVIGGDGTHRGAWELHQEATSRGIKLAVACVPKTIDNDIGTIDRSFGFNTAMAAARNAILNAAVHAQSTTNSVAVVKLMGRHAGYIAASATISARNVDACLIPEVEMDLHGSGGLLRHIQRITEQRGSSLIVVAEGVGSQWMEEDPLHIVYDSVPPTYNDKYDDIAVQKAQKQNEINKSESSSHQVEYDASGNKKMSDIGSYLCNYIRSSVRVRGKPVNVIYSDPSYTIRSVPADAEDAILCLFLAANAVHGAMAGYTGFSVATVNNRNVMIPIEVIVKSSPAYMNPVGLTWQTVLNMTHQPHVINTDEFKTETPSATSSTQKEAVVTTTTTTEKQKPTPEVKTNKLSLDHILVSKSDAAVQNPAKL